MNNYDNHCGNVWSTDWNDKSDKSGFRYENLQIISWKNCPNFGYVVAEMPQVFDHEKLSEIWHILWHINTIFVVHGLM